MPGRSRGTSLASSLRPTRGPRPGAGRALMVLTATQRALAAPVPAPPARHRRGRATVGCAALVAGVLAVQACTCSVTEAAAVQPSAAAFAAPGTIFVANAGEVTGLGVRGTGSVTVYRPGATGNARPEVVITAGVNGPGDLAFDPSGNLWVSQRGQRHGGRVQQSRALQGFSSPHRHDLPLHRHGWHRLLALGRPVGRQQQAASWWSSRKRSWPSQAPQVPKVTISDAPAHAALHSTAPATCG
jgi:hypothetical protein